MKTIIITLMSVLLIQTSFAKSRFGQDGSGGGDPVAVELMEKISTLATFIHYVDSSYFSANETTELIRTANQIEISLNKNEIKDLIEVVEDRPISANGTPKAAVYDSKTSIIKVHRQTWNESSSKQQYMIAMMEGLGLSKRHDNRYNDSKDYLNTNFESLLNYQAFRREDKTRKNNKKIPKKPLPIKCKADDYEYIDSFDRLRVRYFKEKLSTPPGTIQSPCLCPVKGPCNCQAPETDFYCHKDYNETIITESEAQAICTKTATDKYPHIASKDIFCGQYKWQPTFELEPRTPPCDLKIIAKQKITVGRYLNPGELKAAQCHKINRCIPDLKTSKERKAVMSWIKYYQCPN